MNEKLSNYWEQEDFKLKQIQSLINKFESEPGIPEMYNLCRNEKYNTFISPNEDRDYETNLFSEFKQFDGTEIKIKRESKNDLTIISEVNFYNQDNKEIFKLSEIIPEGYTIIESGYIGRDFMNPTFKYIVVHPGFLESVGGRMFFIHELGHAYDYNKTPQGRQEFLQHLKGQDVPERENEAWKYSKQILSKMEQKGLQFLPNWFEKNEMDKWIEFAKKNHNYPENIKPQEGI